MDFKETLKAAGSMADLVVPINVKMASAYPDQKPLTLDSLKNYASGRRPIPGWVFDTVSQLWGGLTPSVTPDDETATPSDTFATPTPESATPDDLVSVVGVSVTPDEYVEEIVEAAGDEAHYRRPYQNPQQAYRNAPKSIHGAPMVSDRDVRFAPTYTGPKPLKVLRPSADGDPAWDVMTDGFARGFPEDTPLMRAWYRTPAAFIRIKESQGKTWPKPLPRMFQITAKGEVHG